MPRHGARSSSTTVATVIAAPLEKLTRRSQRIPQRSARRFARHRGSGNLLPAAIVSVAERGATVRLRDGTDT